MSDAGGGDQAKWSTDPRIGTQLAGYEIESLLGRGGMGVVYRARQVRLGRSVALKVLAPEYAQDENFRARFMHESEMAAAIDHPNVISVYDADEREGVLYLAMRYVDGIDLSKLLQRDGALEPERVHRILSQLGDALEAAHAAGLIHRDIKPANVLIVEKDKGTDQVYLTDFGLTKHTSSGGGLTATGAFVGTIDYVAPEQIEGKGVDARTDIYALGCLAYECVTGKVPFVKDSDVAVMYAHMMDPRPKATESAPHLSPAVDAALEKAMAVDPAARHQSATEFVADLGAALGQGAASAPASPSPVVAASAESPLPSEPAGVAAPASPRRWSPARLGMALVALVVVVAAVFFFTRSGDEKPTAPSAGSETTDAVFVAPDAAASGSGSQDDPVALGRALDMAGEGGTVVLAPGTYEASANPMLLIERGVTIEGAPEGATILKGSGGNADGISISAGTSGVMLSNLVFDGFGGGALTVLCDECKKTAENQNITLSDLEVKASGTPIVVENVQELSLKGINVHDNRDTGFICSPGPCNEVTITDSSFHSSNHRFGEGVRIESGTDVVITSSNMSDNPGNGIFSNAAQTRVIGSRFQDNGEVGAILSGPDSEIRDSIVARNGTEGLLLGEELCDGCSSQGAFTVANVLVADNGFGISIANDNSDDMTLQMFNSIITDNDGTGLRILGGVVVERLDHNLFNTGKWLPVTMAGEGYDETEINNGRFPGDVDAATYASLPSFVAPDDYHLTAASAGVDDGTEEGVTSEVDIGGNPRIAGEGIDRGPYEQ